MSLSACRVKPILTRSCSRLDSRALFIEISADHSTLKDESRCNFADQFITTVAESHITLPPMADHTHHQQHISKSSATILKFIISEKLKNCKDTRVTVCLVFVRLGTSMMMMMMYALVLTLQRHRISAFSLLLIS